MNDNKHGQGTHCTKMCADSVAKNNQNSPKFICPICLPKPKTLGFWWKRLNWASVVRGSESYSHVRYMTKLLIFFLKNFWFPLLYLLGWLLHELLGLFVKPLSIASVWQMALNYLIRSRQQNIQSVPNVIVKYLETWIIN